MKLVKQLRKSDYDDNERLLRSVFGDSNQKVPEPDQPFSTVLIRQTRLLLWKRYCESTKTKMDVLKGMAPPLLFFLLVVLLYSAFDGLFHPGGIEAYILVIGFWTYIQRMVVQILYEKGSRLQESMKMMGMYESAYWISYFISDGVILGFIISFLCALISQGGLFNDGNFGAVLGLLFIFCMSSTTFSFFLSSFSNNAQFGTQSTIMLLMGLYIVFVVNFSSSDSMNVIFSLFPPTAFQVGCMTFLKSYKGISLSSVCGIMVADVFIYAILAWYFTQIWPTSEGVPKPWYFPFLRNYWFPESHGASFHTSGRSGGEGLHSSKREKKDIPIEAANETLLGAATIKVNRLFKTFGKNKVVDDLSLRMYENQIF
eukprot:gene17522-20172_t